MINLLNKFKSLRIENKKKYIVGFADTEGMAYRKDINSSLWDFNIIFKYVLDENLKSMQNIFNIAHFACAKQSDPKLIKPALLSHLNTIQTLRNHYNATNIILCFWNAPHDDKVLKHYVDHDFIIVDLLPWARKSIDNYSGKMSISKLSTYFDIQYDNKIHSALGDTQRLIDIIHKIEPDINKVLNNLNSSFKFNSIDLVYSKSKHDEEEIDRRTISPKKVQGATTPTSTTTAGIIKHIRNLRTIDVGTSKNLGTNSRAPK